MLDMIYMIGTIGLWFYLFYLICWEMKYRKGLVNRCEDKDKAEAEVKDNIIFIDKLRKGKEV